MLNLLTLDIANNLQRNHSTRALLFGTRANSESPCFCGCIFLSAGTFNLAAALMMIFLLFFIVMVPYLKPNCRSLAQRKLCAPHFSLRPMMKRLFFFIVMVLWLEPTTYPLSAFLIASLQLDSGLHISPWGLGFDDEMSVFIIIMVPYLYIL